AQADGAVVEHEAIDVSLVALPALREIVDDRLTDRLAEIHVVVADADRRQGVLDSQIGSELPFDAVKADTVAAIKGCQLKAIVGRVGGEVYPRRDERRYFHRDVGAIALGNGPR